MDIRNRTFWYIQHIHHPSFYHLYLRRDNQIIEGRLPQYLLLANINPLLRATIDVCLKIKYLSVQGWLMIMLQMVQFAAALHAQGKSLSIVV
jgi:hypothetical protein